MDEITASEIVERLRLEPLPGEGGYFRQTFRAELRINPPWSKKAAGGGPVERRAGTAIYYLVTPESFSALHRLEQDEVFHFYRGDPVEQVLWHEGDRDVKRRRLGSDIFAGDEPQAVVPAGIWQGTRLVPGGSWALLGATCAPGFEFDDTRIADKTFLESLRRHLSDVAAILEGFVRG